MTPQAKYTPKPETPLAASRRVQRQKTAALALFTVWLSSEQASTHARNQTIHPRGNMPDTDALGNRMKLYEKAEARRFPPLTPVLARLDGRNFSRYTKNLQRPYDMRLSDLMVETTKFLVSESNASCGYTQSDEITLAWYSQTYFDGRVSKMTSVLAAECSTYFTSRAFKPGRPVFDCRVWCVPTLDEAANCFLWREQDATKNSIQMAAQQHFSHRELQGLHSGELQDKLHSIGVNWNSYPVHFKRGTYVQRRVVRKKFEGEDLPAKHHARLNPDLEYERSEIQVLDMPVFSRVLNRVGVIFHGAAPLTSPSSGV